MSKFRPLGEKQIAMMRHFSDRARKFRPTRDGNPPRTIRSLCDRGLLYVEKRDTVVWGNTQWCYRSETFWAWLTGDGILVLQGIDASTRTLANPEESA